MTERSTLVKYTRKNLLNAISILEDACSGEVPPLLCCRNCLRVNRSVYRCAGCKIDRCKQCIRRPGRTERFLKSYGVLALNLSPAIVQNVLRIYRVTFSRCDGYCRQHYCSSCSKMSSCEVCLDEYCPCVQMTMCEGELMCDSCCFRFSSKSEASASEDES